MRKKTYCNLTFLAITIILSMFAMIPPSQADTYYYYIGNSFTSINDAPLGGNITASATFDSTVTPSFTGAVGLGNVTSFTLSSGPYTTTLAEYPTIGANLLAVFGLTDGAITQWEMYGWTGPAHTGIFLQSIDAYSVGTSYMVIDGVLDPAYAGNANYNDPGRWTSASPFPLFQGSSTSSGNTTYLNYIVIGGLGQFSGIIGDLGGTHTTDAYGFLWAGGSMSVTEAFGPALSASLYDAQGNLLDTIGALGIGGSTPIDLASGDYVLELTDNPGDAAYEITFNEPIAGLSTVPEPNTILLLGFGLFGALGLRRKYKN